MKRGNLWKKYCVVFALLFSVFLPLCSEPKTELETETIEIPELEPEAIYEMKGQDIMTLYQGIVKFDNLSKMWEKDFWNAMDGWKESTELVTELSLKNQKLEKKNDILVGGITVTLTISVVSLLVAVFN
jgi:hypothetical protein